MKKMVYRNIFGTNPKKREVSIEEVSRREMDQISKKWVCKYFVGEKFTADDTKALKEWTNIKKKGTQRNCHILRRVNDKTGENMIICKVLGEIFAVRGLTAYRIVYVNEIKIDIDEEV